MKDIEKIEEYKAIPVDPEEMIYNNFDIKFELIAGKINEIIDYINSKKDQLL